MCRYHWRVLLQGMKKSPTICQWYIAEVLSSIRKTFPRAIILLYMDDILICAPNEDQLKKTLNYTIHAIKEKGFEMHPDKIQCTTPLTYLGLRIGEKTIVPQKITIQDNPRTLRDLHQLCGSINWVRLLLGLMMEDFTHLFQLLRDCEDLDSLDCHRRGPGGNQ